MDIATSGVADDARIDEEREHASRPSVEAETGWLEAITKDEARGEEPGTDRPATTTPTAAALVWLAEPATETTEAEATAAEASVGVSDAGQLEPPAADVATVEPREQAIAQHLEALAHRVRAGELRPLGSGDDPSDAAALAATLAALLDRTR